MGWCATPREPGRGTGAPSTCARPARGACAACASTASTSTSFTPSTEDVPFEESIGELARLRDEGKIRQVGLSNVSVELLTRAQELVPVVSVQNRYSLVDREAEGVVDECERQGIAFLPWYPLAVGELAKPDGALGGVARDRGATAAQVALAWLLARSPVVLPIPGTASVAHLEENVAALGLELTADERAALG